MAYRVEAPSGDRVDIEDRHAFRAADVRRRLSEQKGKCAVCPSDLGASFVRDHRIPRAMGGETTYENLDLICHPCDAIKTPKDITAVAKAKRRAAKHDGTMPPSPFKLKGRGFQRRREPA